jgi:hypothetical protein
VTARSCQQTVALTGVVVEVEYNRGRTLSHRDRLCHRANVGKPTLELHRDGRSHPRGNTEIGQGTRTVHASKTASVSSPAGTSLSSGALCHSPELHNGCVRDKGHDDDESEQGQPNRVGLGNVLERSRCIVRHHARSHIAAA